ncbi:hypothetical protein Lal_00032544 [Lupinus albus]|uniref:Putative adenylylsulfatase transcription factor bHLH family n=1 Tax=Lupinus albus TaxID=3870 RepID=A0A6A4R9Q0_LUPAL|nr:putative adenylylsulfatase transcription factor bHLH family [Lupinus albus]KAF1897784.1 hypothetical protein Lal_00032544 [Lupinus albus]
MEYNINIPNPSSKGLNKNKRVRLSNDPQSVAARERRHRISDRFKILQSMVPGGSKMDTVSMLEEAINYVKFLKTQICFHQTMIDFVDNVHDSSLIMLPPQKYFPHEENIISFQQQNSSISVPQIPLEEQCCFQGEDNNTIVTIDDNMKYWLA